MEALWTYKKIIRRIARATGRYVFNVGIDEDDLFSSLTGGPKQETFSLREAVAASKGSKTACIVCDILSVLVQKNHCALTLAGKDIPPFAAVKAFFWITLILALPIIFLWWIL